jgi:DnaJ-class molecular chaperone
MSTGAGDETRAVCTPCRGTGRLKSGLGGQPHPVTCPWCGGSGRFEPGRDAQQAPAEGQSKSDN